MPPLFMTHKDSPGHAPAVTTQSAFDKVWSKKGWELVNDASVTAADGSPAVTPAAADELRGQALEDALTAAGISGSGLTADEKRAALADHYAAQGA